MKLRKPPYKVREKEDVRNPPDGQGTTAFLDRRLLPRRPANMPPIQIGSSHAVDRRGPGRAFITFLLLLCCWITCPAMTAGAPYSRTIEAAQRIHKALLDLSKKEAFLLLAINADAKQVSIANVQVSELPTDHRLVPSSGALRLGHPLDIELKEPGNVRIRMALVKRGNDVALRISPQIVIGKNNTIDLTGDRITRTARNLYRRVKDLNQQITALTQERQALSVWLISPGNKPLRAVQAAHFQIKILNQAIKTRQQNVRLAQNQCAALGKAAQFVKQLHKTVEIRYEVSVDVAGNEQQEHESK